MQKESFTDKTTKYLVRNPCQPSEPCTYDEDYDPCESSEDITEKDLAILLQEEAAKLQKKHGESGNARDGEDRGKETNITEELDIAEPDSKIKWEDQRRKKKQCKNPIKNPFFTNPFKFSSDLPLPPSAPPPQFFPLTETDSAEKICEKKGKKKKSCKKQICDHGLKDEDTWRKDEDGPTADETQFNDADDKGVEGDVEDETDEEQTRKGEKEDKKKRCRKRSERPACKRNVSDVSISLLPPQIPPLQRDLPPKSPKDIPEVERQVLMACGARPDQKCKKRKEKIKVKNNS